MSVRSGGGVLASLARLVRVYLGHEKPDASAPEERPRHAVVLGTEVLPGGRPSRTLDARVRHAAGLYTAGRVERLVVTGGLGKYPPSEAEVMARILRNAGVPKEAVQVEARAGSTWESALLVAAMATGDGVTRALVVTDPLHCVRACAAFERAGLKAWPEPVYSSPMWRAPWLRQGQFFRESGALVWYRMRYGIGARSRR